MKDRIALIRKESNLNQEDFAKKIGLTKNYISLIETGGRNPSDRTVMDICREFKINEEWLRTGKGPKDISDKGNFSTLLSDIEDSDDEFIKDIIKVYMSLDKNSKEALKMVAKKMAEIHLKKEQV